MNKIYLTTLQEVGFSSLYVFFKINYLNIRKLITTSALDMRMNLLFCYKKFATLLNIPVKD